MTHTTTRQVIHLQVRQTFSLRDSTGKRLRLWIFLYWPMLSSADEGRILSAECTAASERLGYFEKYT